MTTTAQGWLEQYDRIAKQEEIREYARSLNLSLEEQFIVALASTTACAALYAGELDPELRQAIRCLCEGFIANLRETES